MTAFSRESTLPRHAFIVSGLDPWKPMEEREVMGRPDSNLTAASAAGSDRSAMF
jgi:hypothetical protein